MKRKMLAVLIAALALIMIAACTPKAVEDIPGDDGDSAAAVEAAELLDSYLGAFGHVRVLGDIDHILKGEKVDDEPGVTAQSMTAGAIALSENKTELTIPLTLAKYDFDGHRNPGDPEPEKYTRIATGKLVLTLIGAMNAEGTEFTASGYRLTDIDVTLDCDTSTYLVLDLDTAEINAESLDGIFTTSGGIARAAVKIAFAEGKPTGIADVNTPKFGKPSGAFEVNGIASEF